MNFITWRAEHAAVICLETSETPADPSDPELRNKLLQKIIAFKLVKSKYSARNYVDKSICPQYNKSTHRIDLIFIEWVNQAQKESYVSCYLALPFY